MFKQKIVVAMLALCASLAQASGLDSLEQFVKTAKTGRAEFTQVVTAPAKEGQAARSKTSSGTFEFSRPNRFRFIYRKPFEQTIVADGQTLWLYDVDLNQVTSRKQSSVLASSPAALIASAADIKALQADFVLAAAPDKDGLEWVLASPKAKEGMLQSVRVGFKGADLAALEIVDSFGQRSVMSFASLRVNTPLEASVFQFKPPPGADLIQQ
ncbi:outer membrane lipoprotein carrier protein LolA [Rhodoferax lacus]|uniref:Outer-membrane lipoprotein carrier protein n=1 Tax=Rhodoferax lacus TaxID=2184758 RepID=A0A3E1RDU9_9BURK|nr:outer membrane lipoprotein chaperone LolA [Rhodoferax lacus]RFO96770.1 outer membrane lipoprotein carrier protein LolA [Rhodoferax lacus]